MIADVFRVIDKKGNDLVANLACPEAEQHQLKQGLRPNAENSFLWVTVVINHIQACLWFPAQNFHIFWLTCREV